MTSQTTKINFCILFKAFTGKKGIYYKCRIVSDIKMVAYIKLHQNPQSSVINSSIKKVSLSIFRTREH